MNSLLMEDPYTHRDLQFDQESLSSLDFSNVPEHVAIIMDGNRRWAKNRNLPPMLGHAQGAATLLKVVEAAIRFGVKVLTVYAFSTENWQRSKFEIATLMQIFKKNLLQQRGPMIEQGVRLQTIGDLKRFPRDLLEVLEESCRVTKGGDKIDLVLALNYGGRDDIRRAVLAIVDDVAAGLMKKEELSEEKISSYLDTAKWCDPTLFIRTSGEKRLSNFLLWQLSYTEVYITDVLWPDFDERELLLALLDYQQRQRRLGG